MSALAVADAGRGWEDDEAASSAQPRLFALPGGTVERASDAAESAVSRLDGPAATVPTLDDVLSGAWAAVSSGRVAACPVCAGPLRPRWSAGAGAVGGRCGDCAFAVD